MLVSLFFILLYPTIDRMIEEDAPCEDILAQINAAKSALHKAGKVVLERHIKHCVKDGLVHGMLIRRLKGCFGSLYNLLLA